jgi:secondary thiamine-phosphate synthase enzyme
VSARPCELITQVSHAELRVDTDDVCGFHDLTDDTARVVEDSGVVAGIVLLSSLHTTAGLLINEMETGFRSDFREVARRIAPPGATYRHDDMSVRFENLCEEDREFPNGHAHVQHAVIGAPSLVLPVRDARIVLGRWQRVFLIEFDRPRPRRVAVQCMGVVDVASATPAELGEGAGANGAAAASA